MARPRSGGFGLGCGGLAGGSGSLGLEFCTRELAPAVRTGRREKSRFPPSSAQVPSRDRIYSIYKVRTKRCGRSLRGENGDAQTQISSLNRYIVCICAEYSSYPASDLRAIPFGRRTKLRPCTQSIEWTSTPDPSRPRLVASHRTELHAGCRFGGFEAGGCSWWCG